MDLGLKCKECGYLHVGVITNNCIECGGEIELAPVISGDAPSVNEIKSVLTQKEWEMFRKYAKSRETTPFELLRKCIMFYTPIDQMMNQEHEEGNSDVYQGAMGAGH